MGQKNESYGLFYPQGAKLASEAELKIGYHHEDVRWQAARQPGEKSLTSLTFKAASPITIGGLEE
jgi:hypothetical protein